MTENEIELGKVKEVEKWLGVSFILDYRVDCPLIPESCGNTEVHEYFGSKDIRCTLPSSKKTVWCGNAE